MFLLLLLALAPVALCEPTSADLALDPATGAAAPLPALHCLEAATSDPAALACLSEPPPTDAALRAALEACMLRGWWAGARRVLSHARAARVDLTGALHAARARIQASLTSLADSLNSEALAGADIPPAYEWAQSVDQVFLQVKWAHKLDAPATLGCKPEPPAFGADSVAFRAECQRKAFALQLQLWGNVSVEQCTWASASVGRASVTLRKAADGPWPRLLKGSARPPGQHIWWDMKVRG